MTSSRGKASSRSKASSPSKSPHDDDKNADPSGSKDSAAQSPDPDGDGRVPGIPDLMRKALSIGLSGFFLTEETIRKALGDTLPKDWTDFAVDQSERTRKEFLERLTYEMAQTFENIDLAAVLRDLLEGRTLEIKAEVRLGDAEDGKAPGDIRIGLKEQEPKA
jgi:hypothetical protein